MKSNKLSKLKINFQLKNEKSIRKPVIININFGYKEFDLLKRQYYYRPLVLTTGIKLLPSEWDAVNKVPYNLEDRSTLYEMTKIIKQVYEYLSLKGAVDYNDFKYELEEKIKGKEKKKKEPERIRLVDFIRSQIVRSDRITVGTKALYLNFATKLEDFEKRIGVPVMSYNVDEKMYLEFMDFIRLRVNKINAVWSMQKVFKATLHEISRFYKIKVFNPGIELSSRDKIQAETADAVYLNMEQIQRIIEFEPEDDRLYNVKFIFMILLFTGCRESDVYKIVPEKVFAVNGIKFKYARYIAQKTETEVLCPILKPLQDMFDENDGYPPRKITQQKFNLWVKELALRSGLVEEVTTSYTNSLGKKQLVKKQLYEFITSHTGRRSFITNLINFIPIPTLTKITGHKLQDKSIIFAYNKMNLLENATIFCKLLQKATEENPEYFPFDLV